MSAVRATTLKHPLRFAFGIGINALGAAVLSSGASSALGNWIG